MNWAAWGIAALLAVPGIWGGAAPAEPPATHAVLERADAQLREAQERFEGNTNDVRVAWELGRAAFHRAEAAVSSRDRAAHAERGIAACRHAIHLDGSVGAAHFYLGVCLGQLAQARPLTALLLVKEMERCFWRARNLDEKFNEGGPDRTLGLLYWNAPGWPASIGNRRKARQHLERALELSPLYPDNLLNLAEAAVQWKDVDLTRSLLERCRRDLPVARARYSGSRWEPAWVKWDARWTHLLEMIPPPPRPEAAH